MVWVAGISAGLNFAGLVVIFGLVWRFHSKQVAALAEQAKALAAQKTLVEEQKKVVEEERNLLNLFSASRFLDELVATEKLYRRQLARVTAKLHTAEKAIARTESERAASQEKQKELRDERDKYRKAFERARDARTRADATVLRALPHAASEALAVSLRHLATELRRSHEEDALRYDVPSAEARGDAGGGDSEEGRMPGPQQHFPPSPGGKDGGRERFGDS